jgi:hypothetical protein
MTNSEFEQDPLSAGEAQSSAQHQPSTPKQLTGAGQPVSGWTSRDQEDYGAAPLLPYEPEERYSHIHKLLKPEFAPTDRRSNTISGRRSSTVSGAGRGGNKRNSP